MLRIAGRAALFLFISFLSLLFLVGVVVQTPPIKSRILNSCMASIQDQTGHEVHVDQLQLLLPFQFQLKGLSLSDDQGAWVKIDSIKCYWTPWSLLWNHLSITHLELQDLHLYRSPNSQSSSSFTFSLPESPLSLSIDQIELKQCHFPTFPSLPTTDISGQLSLFAQAGESQGNFQISCSDFLSGVTQLQWESLLKEEQLHLNLHASESAGGPLTHLSQLSSYPTGDFSAHIEGGLADWNVLFSPPSQEEKNHLRGEFKWSSFGCLAPLPPLENILGQKLRGRSDFLYFGDGKLQINNLHGSNDHSSYRGWLRFQEGFELREMDLDLHCNRLSPLEPFVKSQIAGELEGKLRYRGMPQSRELSLQLDSDLIKVEGFHLADFTATLIAPEPQKQSLEGMLLCNFHFEELPFSCTAHFTNSSSKMVDIDDLAIDFGPIHLDGELQIDPENFTTEGRLFGDQHPLSGWSDFLKQRLTGTSSMEVVFQRDTSSSTLKQDISLTFHADAIKSRRVKAPELSFQAQIKNIFRNPHGTATLQTKEAKGNGWFMEHLDLKLANDPQGWWSYRINTAGRRHETFQLSTSGELHLIPNQLKLGLNHLEGRVSTHEFHLTQPSELTLNRLQILLTPLFLEVDQGVISASIQDSINGIEGELDLQAFPLDMLNVIRPTTPVSGTLTGHGSITGSRENPKGELQLDLSHFHLEEPGFEQANPVNGTLNISLENHKTQLEASLATLQQSPVSVRGSLPIGLALDSWQWVVDEQASDLDLSLQARGEAGRFVHLFIPDSNRIRGDFDVDLHLGGSLAKPQVRGHFNLHNGEYHSLHTGSLFQRIEAKVQGEGSQLKLTQLSAQDGHHGSLSATGSLALASQDQLRFALATSIHDCLLVDQKGVQAVFDGKLTLEGDTEDGELKGKLHVRSADLSIPEQVTEKVPVIDVTYIHQPEYEPLPSIFAPVSERWQLHLDLLVKSEGQTFVHGRGLMSEWSGEGRVKGTTSSPLLYGRLGLERGEYNFLGRMFNLTHGELHFNGSPTKRTLLSVSAELQLEELTVQAFLTGPLKEPQLTLQSNPAMQQSEILSRILFDKQVQDVSPLQRLELAQTVLSVAKNGGAPDPIGALRRNIGLDRLDISHYGSDPNNVSIHAGKYIARGVFVSLNKSVNSSGNEISVEMRLSDQVKLEGQVGTEVGSKISLKWKKDY